MKPVSDSQIRVVVEAYEGDVEPWMDPDARFDLAFDHAMNLMPEDIPVDRQREVAFAVLERTGSPYRQANPLPSWHEDDRDSFVDLIKAVCGCSAKTSTAIAEAYPGGTGIRSATVAALRQHGATAAQARRLNSAFMLARFVEEGAARRFAKITQPDDVVDYLKAHMGHLDKENFVAVFLDARQQVIDTRVISVGSLSEVSVHPRELFADGIRMRAHSLIMAHNHPSGDPEPSRADIELTKRMVEAGRMLGIPVLDHVVVGAWVTGRPKSVSMAALGLV
jgi:DNA repair protein RadC